MIASRSGAALLALVLLSGCGYRLSGSGSSNPDIPSHIKIIAITPFENRTERPEIEQRITEELASQLNRRGRYRVASDLATADAVLDGAVLDYRTRPVQFTAGGRATRVEAVVTVQATLRDRAEDSVLWSQSGLIFKEQFDIPETGEFFDEETVALDDIARGAAGSLVTAMLEGF